MTTGWRQKASPTLSDGHAPCFLSAVSGFRVFLHPPPHPMSLYLFFLIPSFSPLPPSPEMFSPLLFLAVMRWTAGAPLDPPTESPAGETSGEELETGGPDEALAVALESVLGATKRHKKEVRPSPLGGWVVEGVLGSLSKLLLTTFLFFFLDQFLVEFQGEVKYEFLDHYKVPSLPAKCPYSNFGKVGLNVGLKTGGGLRLWTPLFSATSASPLVFPGRLPTQVARRPPHLLGSPQARGGGEPFQQDPLRGQILQQRPDQRAGNQGGCENTLHLWWGKDSRWGGGGGGNDAAYYYIMQPI